MKAGRGLRNGTKYQHSCHFVPEQFCSDTGLLLCSCLQAGHDVHVLRKSADGWWYGVSDNKKGMFPGRCVKSVRKIPAAVSSIPVFSSFQ